MDKLIEGTVKRKIFEDKNSDFKIYVINPINFEKDEIIIKGNCHDLSEDVHYIFSLEEYQDKKYGLSYNIQNIKRSIPDNTVDIRLFLYEVITVQQTDTLLEVYPNILQIVINNEWDKIDINKLKNINQKRFDKIKEKIIDNFVIVELVDKYKGLITLNFLRKLLKEYNTVENVIQKMNDNPYECLCKISGIGFKKADNIILELAYQEILENKDIGKSKERAEAFLLYLLGENETNTGSSWVTYYEIQNEFNNHMKDAYHWLSDIIKLDSVYYDSSKQIIAKKSTMLCEDEISHIIIEALNKNVFKEFTYTKTDNDILSNQQIIAINTFFNNRISIINGFAGTGKSLTTGKIIQKLKDFNENYLIVAPTGRASQVISKYSGEDAYTIHRALGYIPDNPECFFNEKNKLPYKNIIVDEMSMVDIFLMRKLLKAIDFSTTRLLLVGDNEQIPSVGTGNILHDLLLSKKIPCTTLSEVFRFGTGGIETASTHIRNQTPFINNDEPQILGEDKGYLYIPTNKDIALNNVLTTYQNLLKQGNTAEDILILNYKKSGIAGVQNINNNIQSLFFNKESDKNISIKDHIFFIGDIVMQNVNNYNAIELTYDDFFSEFNETGEEILVTNGQMGKIVEINTVLKTMIISFDDKYILYEESDFNMIQLGYCITIHKSQGGSAKNVILLNTESDIYFLNSNLIYVGVTRAEQLCCHLTNIHTLNKAIKKKANFQRNTFLYEMLIEDSYQ